MPARVHAPPAFGDPAHWAEPADDHPARPVRHAPERINGGTGEEFFPHFLAQCAVPNAQRITLGGVLHVVDTVSGAVAPVEPGGRVREAGPVALWGRIEEALDAYDAAGRPDQTEFRVRVTRAGRYLEHPSMPTLPIAP